MSYREKQSILMIGIQLAILASYCVYVLGQMRGGAASLDNLRAWAIIMLVFIGLGVGATIVLQILFHILLSVGTAVKTRMETGRVDNGELEQSLEAEMMEDERDKLISLKSSQVGFAAAGIGFVAGLVTLVAGYPPGVMLNVIYLSFAGGSILENAAQLYFYRRGVRHA